MHDKLASAILLFLPPAAAVAVALLWQLLRAVTELCPTDMGTDCSMGRFAASLLTLLAAV